MEFFKVLRNWYENLKWRFLRRKVHKSSFHPVGNLEGRNNYKIYYRIEEDGRIKERVFLNISDMNTREHLILFHYLQNEQKIFLNDKFEFNILSKDDPWDFVVETSLGQNFSVEITSIADDERMFKNFKAEELFNDLSLKKEITLRELVKINHYFPNEEWDEIIKYYKKDNTSKSDLVHNPFHGREVPLFLSTVPRGSNDLSIVIRYVIDKKNKKKHCGKQNTVLIIDNRTLSFERADVYEAKRELDEFLWTSLFREVWFYTGYYSDLSGNNAEFSFIPLKIGAAKVDRLALYLQSHPLKDDLLYI